MPNYLDLKNEKVKKYWDDKKKGEKIFNKLVFVVVGIFLLLSYLNFTNKLDIGTLFIFIFIVLGIIIWFIHSETIDLHNRINIIDDAFENDKAERWIKETESDK